jgi:uncharacterized protein DUF3617
MVSCFRNPARALTLSSALVFAAVLVQFRPAFAQGSDDLWEITSKMEMPGMPMSMPAQVVKVCAAKNARDDEFIPKQGDCKVVDSKRTGNNLAYRMTCSTPEPSTVEGETHFAAGAYDGKMRMTMTSSKQSMQMTYSGKRVGNCTASK